MTPLGIRKVIDLLRLSRSEGVPDGELLDRFVTHRDEDAIAELVVRAGPKVYAVCRLIFGQHQLTEVVLSKAAKKGAFTLGMIGDFALAIRGHGAWWYRRLFWEAGVLGQVLYLEAEAAGVRATGIGCYFDDAFHELLGLTGNEFQDLYHFTIGGPIEDHRLMTLPPYAHLYRP